MNRELLEQVDEDVESNYFADTIPDCLNPYAGMQQQISGYKPITIKNIPELGAEINAQQNKQQSIKRRASMQMKHKRFLSVDIGRGLI